MPHTRANSSDERGRATRACSQGQPTQPHIINVPYLVAIVSIDGAPGCSGAGNVVGCAPETVEIGAAVSAVFEAAEDPTSGQKYLIPQWELASD